MVQKEELLVNQPKQMVQQISRFSKSAKLMLKNLQNFSAKKSAISQHFHPLFKGRHDSLKCVKNEFRLIVCCAAVLYHTTKIKRTISAVFYVSMSFILPVSLIQPHISDLFVPSQVPLEVRFIHELLAALGAVYRRALVATPTMKLCERLCRGYHAYNY